VSTVDKTLFSTKSDDVLWDYVVIGSGMGGMTTAAALSKLGKRVLVLEQHYVPGGFTHTFRRKKWTWDVGVHAVGEVDEHSMLGRVLHALTDGRLAWSSLGDVYDEFHYPDLRIDFPNEKKHFVDNLRAAFPSEHAAIGAYLSRIKEVAGAMRNYYLSRLVPPAWAPLADPLLARNANKLLLESTENALERLSSDARLRTVLTAQWGYYGVPPARSSFAIHALVAKHFLYGGFYPTGGAARIAEGLLGTVAKAGGWTRIRADVAEILVENRRATGVRLQDGEVIRARAVVSAIGALPTVTRLLPEPERQRAWAQSIASLKPSPAHVCLYLGFRGDIRAAGATAANKWFYETWSSDAVTWDVRDPDGALPEAPILYCSFPSLKDPMHDPGPEQLHTGEVVTFIPTSLFDDWREGRWKRRGEDYEAFKQRLADRLLDQLCRHMPRLRSMVAFAELSTPLSTEHFTRAAGGGIYGLEPTPARYKTRALRPRTPIGGLLLSGADMASVGVMGAMVGGMLSAVAAEPMRALPWLRGAARQGGGA
jgi:all-trans-retinol 13,14-reductase